MRFSKALAVFLSITGATLSVGAHSSDLTWADVKGSYKGIFRSTEIFDPNSSGFTGKVRIELYGANRVAIRETTRQTQYVSMGTANLSGNKISISANDGRVIVFLEYNDDELEGTYKGRYKGVYSVDRATDHVEPDLDMLNGKTFRGQWFNGKDKGDVTMVFGLGYVDWTLSKGTTGSGNYDPWSSRALVEDGYLNLSSGSWSNYFRVYKSDSEIVLDGFYETREKYRGNIVVSSN